jgi:hypothetical protein
MEPIYISGNEAFYDEEKELWYCYIGKNNQKKTLRFSVWAKGKFLAIKLARLYCKLLNEVQLTDHQVI